MRPRTTRALSRAVFAPLPVLSFLVMSLLLTAPVRAERLESPLELMYAPDAQIVAGKLIEINPVGRIVIEPKDVLSGKTKPPVETKARKPAPEAAKPAKVHKAKLVRDSFTIPKDEYAVLAALKARALGLGQHVRKSELLRAGIQALAAMNDRTFLKAIADVPTLKTGRPKAD